MRALETWAIVLGAGSGERLGADRPKAFVRFAGGTLIAASLEAFEQHPGIDGVVVTIPEGYEEHIGLVADDIGAGKIATAVPGGPSRAESVAIALDSLPVSADFVLVHDAARPVVDAGLIDRVLAGLAAGADGVVQRSRSSIRSSASTTTARSRRRSSAPSSAQSRHPRAFP